MLNTVAMTILAINAIHVNRDFQKGPIPREVRGKIGL
jgi:hypothetical protein